MFSKSISASILLFSVVGAFHVVRAAIDNDHRQQQLINEAANILAYEAGAKTSFEISRERYQPITDCMFVTSENGPFSYISPSDSDDVCGIYFLTDPDRTIEVHFESFDVPCDHHGLLAVVDGWELNGELFPSEGDHSLPIKERVTEFCGKSRWYRSKKIFTSSQNAALLQYRIPMRGKGFVVSARYPKNPRPCNVLSVSTTDPFTLRNYGRRINCTLIAIYPGIVQVIALGVGGTNLHGVSRMTETGTLHKCDTKSPQDQVQIGGSRNLDTTKLDVIDSICGIDSKPDIKESVPYDVTIVRLISSGYCDNSVTVAIRSIIDNDMLEIASGL
ncbi:Corticotropin-releasing factor-binding protein [Camponotus floridanus]|uniref:Corticotropin-releasing factor-binding protein n=1 Tax=Camponotus floridanus TaxID=104421 RepID=E2A941_CAMFO|nr:corticotropin-releasing factor-binding protein [Camponotus floridanus]EFN70026.1 Corticotropin-releasing factor-binding protein [Camponotus floridanus]